MKNKLEYLPEAYTVELDFYNYEQARRQMNDHFALYFRDKDKRTVFEITISPGHDDTFFGVNWGWYTPDNEWRTGSQEVRNSPTGKFYRMAVSFNQRALKIYFDGVRLVNITNCAKATNFCIDGGGYGDNAKFTKNIRLAQGAVPLYDRMMNDGKFITDGITFDVGKSTIKPESMGEINRIVTLMTENPTLKFSVEGHTDSTGNAATNQTLSEARSQAVVDKLVSLGIAADRLKAAGKGQTSPIADNGTDEGRAKNRRVEFVKL
jgi:outer membrane protein OmpA-like peptidoglycan-associated protein